MYQTTALKFSFFEYHKRQNYMTNFQTPYCTIRNHTHLMQSPLQPTALAQYGILTCKTEPSSVALIQNTTNVCEFQLHQPLLKKQVANFRYCFCIQARLHS